MSLEWLDLNKKEIVGLVEKCIYFFFVCVGLVELILSFHLVGSRD